MDNAPSPPTQNQTAEPPEPEALKPRVDDSASPAEIPLSTTTPLAVAGTKRQRHRTYQPSHKATFIGLAVVVAILAVNAGILGFVLKNKAKTNDLAAKGQVSISPSVLSKIGVKSTTLGDSGIQLVVDPNAQFNDKVTVAGDVKIGGQLKLNSKFIASDANLTQLEAGNTSLGQLEVNGNSTLTGLILRSTLDVTGATQLRGAVTVGQLLTVNNSVNVLGNLAIGGTLTTSTFSARSLTSTSTLTIGGHVITGGSAPSVSAGGGALGSNGTVGISGDDSAGIISINIGVNAAASGTLASVSFHNQYSGPPRVVITPVGPISTPCSFYVTNLTVNGFTVGDNCVGQLAPGGYGMNYIVEQ